MTGKRFCCLLYREWVVSQKNMKVAVEAYGVFMLMAVLMALSFRFGNLRLIKEQQVIFTTRVMIFIMALGAAGAFMSALVEGGSVKDELVSWKRFRATTPLTHWQIAAVKYTAVAIAYVFSLLLGFFSLFLVKSCFGEAVGRKDIALLLVVNLILTSISVSMQILILIFHSLEKVFMIMFSVGVVLEICLSPVLMKMEDVGLDEIKARLLPYLVRFSPFCIPACILLMLLGFWSTAMLTKRREK